MEYLYVVLGALIIIPGIINFWKLSFSDNHTDKVFALILSGVIVAGIAWISTPPREITHIHNNSPIVFKIPQGNLVASGEGKPLTFNNCAIYSTGQTAIEYFYKCTQAGTTGSSEPSWPTTPGGTVTGDGTCNWVEDTATVNANTSPGTDISAIQEKTHNLAMNAAINGEIIVLYSHGNNEDTGGAWSTILDVLKQYQDAGLIEVTSLQMAAYEMRNDLNPASLWTYSGGTSSRTYNIGGDYHIGAQSAFLKKGVSIGLTTDYFGGTVHNPPNIGLDDTQLSGGGLSLGPGLTGGNYPRGGGLSLGLGLTGGELLALSG